MNRKPKNWKPIILRDICTAVNYGYTASASKDPVGPKFLRITDIVPELIDWDSVPYCQIDQKDYNKYVLHEGDIVIARTGATTGYAKHLRNIPNSVFASYLVRIRVNQNCCDRYIGLVVESEDYKRFIKANISGAAQPQANAQVLTSFPMLLPPLPSQRKIAAILSAYDDLIENNTHRIKILEEMAQLLYREWFVKLRFPGHEKVRMVESELGPIPEGWEVGKLGEIIEFQKGKKAKNVIEEQCDGFIPYLLIDGLKNYNYDAYTDDKKMLIAYETDCIMVMDGASSGYVSIGHYGAVGSTLARITIKGNLNSYFLYQFLQANYKIISDNNTGSAIPHTNKDFINGMLIPIPPVSLIRIYTDHIKPIFKLTWKLRKKNTTLRRTRDLLLPKLISGKLDVEDLDIAMGGD